METFLDLLNSTNQLTKKEHIEYWKTGAEESWQGALLLMEGKQYALSAFCFHLCIEKLLKGIWVKNNESNYPPRIHNLSYLHDGAKLNLDIEYKVLFKTITAWNQEGRYQEYISKLYKSISKKYLDDMMNDLLKLKQCLQEILL